MKRRTQNPSAEITAGKRTAKSKRERSRGGPAEAVSPKSRSSASSVAEAGFPIVGIGASAGGLEAFTLLLKHLPADTGLGFVLVQHLDPQHKSALPQLLARDTSMPVHEVTDNLRVEANHIYVIPPNTNMFIARGVLKLQPRQPAPARSRTIDSFFESLAHDQHERAVGVILSGTATDGTLGLEAIKAEGGITFAQDDSARYDSMPRSAVAAGCVDFVLSPENIAQELARIAKHPYVAGRPFEPASRKEDRAGTMENYEDGTPPPPGGRGIPGQRDRAGRGRGEIGTENGYGKILLLLRNHSGVDFSLYKPTTIQRRIARRMVLHKQDTPEGYAGFLRGNDAELEALYTDVLIGVTSFFRNPGAFDVLKRKVFPKLLQQRAQEPLRVWVLGCSTGQEAYSIAMVLVESAEEAARARKLQVFATDLNEAVLEKARHGLYPRSLVQDLSPERLRRFFVEEEGGYRISKSLREMVVFARQNLINDPPFSRIDLISCRNLLIYLEPNLQQKALPMFHCALKPEGFLFLGASESIGRFTDLFEPADKKHKIYSRKAAPTPTFQLPVKRERGERQPTLRPMQAGPVELPDAFRDELNAQREADRVTVNQFAPPAVLVNAGLQILQFRGPTSAYLQPPTGKASFEVLKMAREGLMLPLRAALQKAKKENKTTRRENVAIKENGLTRRVNLEVIPLKNLRERCFLILFEDAENSGLVTPRAPSHEPVELRRGPKASRPAGKREESRQVVRLESELSETRDYLQSIREQNEVANEELQASNEEVQSANEELQSINEELETSKEELESANEELTTVNEEMATRNAELNRLNADLNNLQTSTKLPIVLVGRDLTIRRFSPQAEKIFNLQATDVGRPLGGIRHNLVVLVGGAARSAVATGGTSTIASKPSPMESPFPLEDMVREVIDTVRELEREVRDRDGRWHSLRARPYMTLDNKIDGAVVVVVDIDEIKRSEQEARAARDYAEATIRTARDPMVVLRADLRVNTANEAFYRAFKVTREQTEGSLIYDVAGGAWQIPKLRALLQDILPRNSFFDDFEMTHEFPGIGHRTLLLNARQLDVHDTVPLMILLSIEDLTERLHLEAAVRHSEIRFRRLFEAACDGILILDAGTRKITDANPFMTDMLGYTREELLGLELWEIGLAKDGPSSRAVFHELQQKETIRYEDLPLQTKAGGKREVEVVANRYTEDGRQVIQCNIRDITGRKRAAEELRLSHAELESQTKELQRFNRAAVGRELRMIELKKQVNEISQRLGQPAPYSLEFEETGEVTDG